MPKSHGAGGGGGGQSLLAWPPQSTAAPGTCFQMQCKLWAFHLNAVFNHSALSPSLTHRFTLSSRGLMRRKWILQVGFAPPSALTSLALLPMRLVFKHLGPAQVCGRVAFRPSHASVQTCISPVTKDEEHSMCQRSICVP